MWRDLQHLGNKLWPFFKKLVKVGGHDFLYFWVSLTCFPAFLGILADESISAECGFFVGGSLLSFEHGYLLIFVLKRDLHWGAKSCHKRGGANVGLGGRNPQLYS